MNLTDDQVEKLYVFAKGLAERGTGYEEIERLLSQRTDNPEVISGIINRLKQIHHAVARKNGLIKIGFGSLLLITGFLITCINFHANQSFTAVMYSTSVAGLVLVFWGLYDIMG